MSSHQTTPRPLYSSPGQAFGMVLTTYLLASDRSISAAISGAASTNSAATHTTDALKVKMH